MPTQLTKLRSPGNQVEKDLAGNAGLLTLFHNTWTTRLGDVISRPPRPLFYDPVKTPTQDDADTATVKWTAFPKRLHPITATPTMDDFRQGDEGPDDPDHEPGNSRGWQDEYCEWMVEKNAAGKITRVVFTCENPDYWDELWSVDSDSVVALYKTFIHNSVVKSDLHDGSGNYLPENKWNNSTKHAMHLVSAPNNLFAEVRLAADATLLRKRDAGTPITDQDGLIRCAGFGSEGRHSDPSIGFAVNSLARDERAGQITLQDPFGLYIDKDSLDLASGFELPSTAPAGAHPKDYWQIVRGTDEFVLRVEYSVPAAHGFTVGDIKIDGELIRYGGQIAAKMQIKLTTVYADIQTSVPAAFFCGTPDILGFLDPGDLERMINLAAPAGATGAVIVLCTRSMAPSATVRELNNRVTLTLGTEISITDVRFRVFNATIAIASTAVPGPAFFEAINPNGRRGISTDPGLRIVPASVPIPTPFALAPIAETKRDGDMIVSSQADPRAYRSSRPKIVAKE